MKVNMLVRKEVNLKPGDAVILNIDWPMEYRKTVFIERLVENMNQVYVVFSDGTWRPLSTYGLTWRKVGA